MNPKYGKVMVGIGRGHGEASRPLTPPPALGQTLLLQRAAFFPAAALAFPYDPLCPLLVHLLLPWCPYRLMSLNVVRPPQTWSHAATF